MNPEYRPTVRALAHVGVVSHDIAEAISSLTAVFGVTWETPRRRELDLITPAGPVDWWFKVAHSSGPIGIELLEGPPGSIWETDGVARLHHVAYWSGDLQGEIALLQSEGWAVELTMRGPDGEVPAVFAYLVKQGEPRTELIARSHA